MCELDLVTSRVEMLANVEQNRLAFPLESERTWSPWIRDGIVDLLFPFWNFFVNLQNYLSPTLHSEILS